MRRRLALILAGVGLTTTVLTPAARASGLPVLLMTPTSGPAGTQVSLDADCLNQPNSSLFVTMTSASDATKRLADTEYAQSDGSSYWITVPAFLTDGTTPAPAGVYSVTASCRYDLMGFNYDYAYEPVDFTLTASPPDTTTPVWSLPADIVTAASEVRGARVSYVANATDASTIVSQSCSPASGSMFPVGLTTVVCTARDVYGNEGVGRFTVTVDGSGLPAPTYTITDLGPASTRYAMGYGINAAGVVAVHATAPGDTMPTAHRWASGTAAQLGLLPATAGSKPWAINASGTVVGQSGAQAVAWDEMTPVALGVGEAFDVNDAGVVVGVDRSGEYAAPFVRSPGSAWTRLPLGGLDRGAAWAINESGSVAGEVEKLDVYGEDPDYQPYSGGQSQVLLEPGFLHAARWDHGVLTEIVIPGVAGYNGGRDVAEDGAVLVYTVDGRGFVWNGADAIRQVQPPTGFRSVDVSRMNDAHTVVGSARRADGTASAMLARDGSPAIDLQQTLSPTSGWSLNSAYDINNAEEIVGYGMHDGLLRAFLMAPIVSTADNVPPTALVTAPVDGATYSVGESVNAHFSCADLGGSGLASCTGDVADGASISTAAAGTHQFQVTAVDGAGNIVTTIVTYSVVAGYASSPLTGASQTVTTDPAHLGATSDAPLQTVVQVPAGLTGTVTVTPTSTTGAPPAGYDFLGQQLQLSGPVATAENPYVVAFTVDASMRTDGAGGTIAVGDLQVLRNGALVADCTDPTWAVPDPCVASRLSAAGGDAVVTVRTSAFSRWNLGRLDYDFAGFYQPVDNAPTLNTVNAGAAVPVKFRLGGYRGLNVFAGGSPTIKAVSCGNAGSDALEQTVTAATSRLTYDATSDTYNYVWKTDRTWGSSCRTLTLAFRDGTSRVAAFSFPR